ncbi:Crp/Fnr family transcriptional regulator [Wenzhouxiangella sp. XN24]|uniref:Crp/Fnr family transcriptional regulator n=1 Tax=Wenzhouxiangella sp. XN24 TaxID=2713569 RepID=UPI0013ED02CD|nr:Crp/Fnr family transcriptional regulator [Wenzhouxiangella sp. XN24]NGX15338.1 Crp/Fnr family transcriptional regulator [Wenzhouxiangella sp. XN24]
MAVSSAAFRELEAFHQRGRPTGLAPGRQAATDEFGSIRRFAVDGMLFREGAEAASLFAIREGLVKLVRHLPNGRARIVGLHGPGAVLGSPANDAAPAVNPHSAIALGDVVAVSWQAGSLQRLRRERPGSYIELLESLFGQVQQADFWITEFSTGCIRSRVARLILFLARLRGAATTEDVELLTCQDMGDILGVTPESVSRVVASLKRMGTLEADAGPGHGQLRCDLAALRRIAAD